MKTIELTDEEISTLIDALGDWLADDRPDERTWLRRQDRGADLDMELRELLNRDDGWGDQDDHPEQAQNSREAAWEESLEAEFIQAGIDARERAKASSRAAERRTLNFSALTCDVEQSETQRHDLWKKPDNDPADW